MKKFSFEFETHVKSSLPDDACGLVDAAESAAERAYAPYSRFSVGAALLLTDGSIITGANHENAAFPAGICAERAAIAQLDMHANNPVRAIAIAYHSSNGIGDIPLSPCGICRQSILEVQLHQGAPVRVYMASPDGEVIVIEDASYLLPFYFSGKFL